MSNSETSSSFQKKNNPWFRLWCDMVNDPKWRTIARISGQKIGDVIATFIHMMTLASNAEERGRTEGWSDEDVATALDIETEQVTAIRAAMQGRVIDGDYLLRWEKRQPIREDDSAGRSKAWREKQAEEKRKRTQANASELDRTPEKRREEKRREEESKAEATAAPEIPSPFIDASPVDLSIAMRSAGIKVQSANPVLIALSEQGVSVETLMAACEVAKHAKPNEVIGAGYVFKIVERWAADAATLKVSGAMVPQARASPSTKFNLGVVDRSADQIAMQESMRRQGVEVPAGDVEFK